MPQSGVLRIKASSPGRVYQASNLLYHIEWAYSALCLVDRETDYAMINQPYIYPRMHLSEWNDPFYLRRILLPEEILEIGKVSFQSPGFWEFVGALNPLEQLRKYLSDRHERRKDRDYRNRSEERKLELENELLALEAMKRQVEILGNLGMSSEDIRLYLQRAIKPMNVLGQLQDNGVIDDAELIVADSNEKNA